MLSRAVNDVLDCVSTPETSITSTQMQAKTQALEWLADTDDPAPLSFYGICEMLGLQPYTILDRLEQRSKEKSLELVLPKKETQNSTILQDATAFLKAKLLEFGHDVDVKVTSTGEIVCSNKALIPICKSLLGRNYK